MATQNFNIEIRYYNGKPRLYVDVTDSFSVTVNKFEGNDTFYAHLSRRGKSVSIPFNHMEEMMGIIPALKQRLTSLNTAVM